MGHPDRSVRILENRSVCACCKYHGCRKETGIELTLLDTIFIGMKVSSHMTDVFKAVYQHPLLSHDDLQQIASRHSREELEKGAVLLKKGRIADEYYLLESGLVRSWVHDYDGNEITTDFFTENEIVIVPTSLFQRIPSQETVLAVTDAVVWKISFGDFQELFHSIPGFTEWGRLWFTQQLFAMKQRSLEMITVTATNRYLKLMQEKPEIMQFVPLKQIASYLGITDTSLSRIRKEIAG